MMADLAGIVFCTEQLPDGSPYSYWVRETPEEIAARRSQGEVDRRSAIAVENLERARMWGMA